MIDERGNIVVERGGDVFLPLAYQDADGSQIDISTADIVLTVAGGLTVTPGADPQDAKGRRFHFTPAHAAQIGSSPREYQLTLTAGGAITVLMPTVEMGSATIRAEGFLA